MDFIDKYREVILFIVVVIFLFVCVSAGRRAYKKVKRTGLKPVLQQLWTGENGNNK